MSIAKLTTIPSSNQRIGAATCRLSSSTVRQMRWAAAANSGNGPNSVVGANDFLVFARVGRISGTQVTPFWSPHASAVTGTQFGMFLNNTGNSMGVWWRYSGATRDITLSVAPVLPNVAADGSTFTMVWQKTDDQHRIGYLNGHTLTITWSSWVTNLDATLGDGIDWNNYSATNLFYINSSATANYFAGMQGALTFVAVSSGQMAPAGLGTDAEIAQVLRDPQRIFDAGRTNILGVVSYGDVHRSGARLQSRVPVDLASGDTLVCPNTAKTLTLEIGTNTGTGGFKANQVYPDYTLPTVNVGTEDVGKDGQPPAQSFQPGSIVVGSATIQLVTIAGSSGAKRHTYIAVADADGHRVRPPIHVPFTWFYTDENAGVYSKAESKFVQVTSSPDNHWHTAGVIVGGTRLVMHPSFHSEGNPTSGVVNTPATNDCGWGIAQYVEYEDPSSFDSDGFAVIEPMDDLVTWTEAPGSSSSHHEATCSYCSPCVASGDGGYVGSVISQHRARDSNTGWNLATWYNPNFGTTTQNVQLTTEVSATMSAGIPVGTFDLGGGYFIVVITPRYSGAGSFSGMIGFIGHNGANFATEWYSARTGAPLTLPLDRGDMEVQFGYPENDVSPLTNAKACTTFECGFVNGHVVNLFAVGGVGSITTATPTYAQLLLRTWKFDSGTKIMGRVDEIDLTTIIGDVLGNDPNDSGNPEIQRYESSSSIQPCASTNGFVLWLRSRDGGTFTNGTHYSDFATRYGKRVIGIYFHDPADLSKWAWLTEDDGVTLFEAWDVADDGGLSCGPHTFGVARSDSVPLVVFTNVNTTSLGSTIRPIVYVSGPISRASGLFSGSTTLAYHIMRRTLSSLSYARAS